jgi:hypothetical protein
MATIGAADLIDLSNVRFPEAVAQVDPAYFIS